MDIKRPHDKIFKETFSRIEVAKSFIKDYLPEGVNKLIDLNTLEPQKDTFINKELEEVFSDLVFKVNIKEKEAYISFLFEHKSYASKDTALQLLKYILEIWTAKYENEKAKTLPIVIPLVIYHGKNRWNIKTTLGEVIEGYYDLTDDIKKFIPNFEYLIYDISRYTDEQIKGEIHLRLYIKILRDMIRKSREELRESLIKDLVHLLELETKEKGIEYIETFIRYILNTGSKLTKEDITHIAKEIGNYNPKGSDFMMSIAQQLREEGRKEGIEIGIEKGIEKGIIETARNMLLLEIETEKIVKATGLTEKQVRALKH